MLMGTDMKKVLKTKVNKEAQVLDYGNEKDFCKVWDDGFKVDKPVILIWDGQNSWEEDQGNFLTPHLTPLDWALAFSIKVLEQNSMEPNFRIHIVDLTGADHETWSMRMRHQLIAEMPWLSLHAPLIPDGKRYRKGYLPIVTIKENGEEKEGLLFQDSDPEKWALRSIGRAATSPEQTRDTLKYIAGQWATTIVRSHDHHDLNNILGPLLLINPNPHDTTTLRKAFLLKLKWSGSNLPSKASKESTGADELSDSLKRVDILAIDDNINKGWGVVLSDVLGLKSASEEESTEQEAMEEEESTEQEAMELATGEGEGEGENYTLLWGTESPDVLMEYLNPDDDSDFAECYAKRSYDSPLWDKNKNENETPWILVLDIHFLTGDKEKRLINCLLEITKRMVRHNNKLAWPGFNKEEIEAVNEWLRSGDGDSRGYDLALSLLPRLSALRWPAVPIFIFSGTHRRNLIETLQEYGNIVLAPSKPNLLGSDTVGEAQRFVDGWRAEFKIAGKLVETQRKLIRLAQREKQRELIRLAQREKQRELIRLAQREKRPIPKPNWRHIVIALDETGAPPTHIGGVLLVSEGKDKEKAKQNSVTAQESLRKGGVCYYDFPPYYFETHSGGGDPDEDLDVKQKGVECRCQVRQVLNDICNHTKLGALRIGFRTRRDQQGDTFKDELYLRRLSDILEVCLSEHLPSIGFDMSRTSISVWLPSKLSSSNNITDNITDATKYDLRLEYHAKRAETIGGWGSAYAVLLRAIGERKNFREIQQSLSTIATRKIPYSSNLQGDYDSATEWCCPNCQAIQRPWSITHNRPKILCNKCAPVSYCDGCEKRANSCGRCGLCISCNQAHACEPHHTEHLGVMLASYSITQHLADEYICPDRDRLGNRYSYDSNISFDMNTENKSVRDFLVCARSFGCEKEEERDPTAFRLAHERNFFLKSIEEDIDGKNEERAITARLIGELSKYALTLSGNELIDLAGLPIHGSTPHSTHEQVQRTKAEPRKNQEGSEKIQNPNDVPVIRHPDKSKAHRGNTFFLKVRSILAKWIKP